MYLVQSVFCEIYRGQRILPVLTPSFPTRSSSERRVVHTRAAILLKISASAGAVPASEGARISARRGISPREGTPRSTAARRAPPWLKIRTEGDTPGPLTLRRISSSVFRLKKQKNIYAAITCRSAQVWYG